MTELYRLTMLQAEEIYKGAETLTVAELAHRTGLDPRTIRRNFVVSSVGVSKSAYALALSTPKEKKKEEKKKGKAI